MKLISFFSTNFSIITCFLNVDSVSILFMTLHNIYNSFIYLVLYLVSISIIYLKILIYTSNSESTTYDTKDI